MISNIRLQQFRSYRDASFEFEPGVNIIIGPNASGKTNLLEGILVVARGGSYRAQAADLVARGSTWARLDSDTNGGQRTIKLQQNPVGRTTRSLQVEGKTYLRPGTSQLIPVVLFEPNHLQMLTGSPELRRDFVDNIICQLKPGYEQTLRHYKRALAQRNRLLKSGTISDPSQLFVWDIRLSDLGAQIALSRQELVARLQKNLAATYGSLAGAKTKLNISYSIADEPVAYGSKLLKRLEKNRSLDLMRGFTADGPHREDVLFEVAGVPLASTASRGEARTILLALKILELSLLEKGLGQKPLLLMDDVFSELDGARRRALTRVMQSHQTFITTTDADVIGKDFGQHANVLGIGGNST